MRPRLSTWHHIAFHKLFSGYSGVRFAVHSIGICVAQAERCIAAQFGKSALSLKGIEQILKRTLRSCHRCKLVAVEGRPLNWARIIRDDPFAQAVPTEDMLAGDKHLGISKHVHADGADELVINLAHK